MAVNPSNAQAPRSRAECASLSIAHLCQQIQSDVEQAAQRAFHAGSRTAADTLLFGLATYSGELVRRLQEQDAAETPSSPLVPGRDVGLQATWEIAALMQALVNLYPAPGTEDQRPFVLRGLALRASKLNSVVMSIFDDEWDDGPMRKVVLGETFAAEVGQ